MSNKSKEFINADLFRYVGKSGLKNTIKYCITNPGFRYMYFHRKYSNSENKVKSTIYKLILTRYRFKYGYEISSNAKIGPGLYIGHLGTIVINPDAKIGKNVNIAGGGVTIGQQNRGPKKGSPTIGDKVWIGNNSTIVGKITIGNNVLIAPGAYINFDVPDNSIVIGNPGTIKKSKNATEGYIENIYTA